MPKIDLFLEDVHPSNTATQNSENDNALQLFSEFRIENFPFLDCSMLVHGSRRSMDLFRERQLAREFSPLPNLVCFSRELLTIIE